VSAGYVGIMSVDLHFPESGSLKTKRKDIQSAKAQLSRRFGAAVAEVDYHDLWQRSRITMTCVAREYQGVNELLDGAEQYLWSQSFTVGAVDKDVIKVGE